MVGDSITYGAEWHEMFKNTAIVNRGIGGDTAAGILNRIDSIISTGAKKSFIMVGINDLNNGTSVNDVYLSYELIIEKLKQANITPYIQSTIYAGEKLSSDLNTSISSLNSKLEKLSKKENLIYIDLNKGLSSDGLLNKKFTKDDVHLNGERYLIWRNLISPYIK
jgi:lysophospholipase L1-like esterase